MILNKRIALTGVWQRIKKDEVALQPESKTKLDSQAEASSRTSQTGLMNSASMVVNTRKHGCVRGELRKGQGQCCEEVYYCWKVLRERCKCLSETPKQCGGQRLSRSTDLIVLMEVRYQGKERTGPRRRRGDIVQLYFLNYSLGCMAWNWFWLVSGGSLQCMARKDTEYCAQH